MPKDTLLFTYNLKEHCPDTPQYFTAEVKYGTSTVRSVTISNGQALLAQAIGPNNNKLARNISLIVKYKGNECEIKSASQKGCSCEEFFVAESFEVSVNTFGVNTGETIGSYSKKQDTDCPDDAITATLQSGGVTYPLVCSNDVIKLGGTKNIEENINHDSVPFTLTVKYNGEVCDTAVVNQKGVACNCGDVKGKISQFVMIPKTGLTAGSQLGTYSLAGTQCSDGNDCMKIEEQNNLVGVELKNGKVLTTTVIGNNDDVTKPYNFIVYYKVNNKWRQCDVISTSQKGLECECSSIDISVSEEEGQWAVFPYAGTHDEWVPFATGDTGLYQYKGTPQQKLFGVCGKIGAKVDSQYLKQDTEQTVPNRISNIGDKVRVIGEPLTEEERQTVIEHQGEEYIAPHKYTLYVNIKEIQGTTDVLTLKPVITFSKYKEGSWVEEDCTDLKCGFKISGEACDCNKKPELSTREVACEGGFVYLGIISQVNKDMSITAEILNPDNSHIKSIQDEFDISHNYKISGNVEHNSADEVKEPPVL